MSRHKTYAKNTQIGEEGQTFAAATVTRLGPSWHDRRVDHGIDGEIELVEPTARRLLNEVALFRAGRERQRFRARPTLCRRAVLTTDDS